MDDNEQSFLDSLAADDDDEVVRLIYADWLEEHGRPEEAERQRNWRSAKRWLVKFVETNNLDPNDPDPWHSYVTYSDLMERAREAHNDGDYHIILGDNMEMTEALWSQGKKFWRQWSIVTGIRIPDDTEGSYSCGC